MAHTLASLSDLQPAPYNPRTITPEAQAGLKASIEKFGDVAQIVWNRQSGRIVTGHQRVQVLKDAGAVFAGDPPRLLLGDREFPIKIVDWDEQTEKAANVAANNPHTSGEFSMDIVDVLDDVDSPSDVLFDVLREDFAGVLMDDETPTESDPRKALPKEGRVSFVIPFEQVSVFERALQSAGGPNRAEALLKICQAYLSPIDGL